MAATDLVRDGFRDMRFTVLVALVAFSLLLEVVVHWYLDIAVVYSHFFYVPVVLAAVWYGKRAVIVSAILGGANLAGAYYTMGYIGTAALGRTLMFFVIALVVGEIADRMRREQEQIINDVADAAIQSGAGGATPAQKRGRILSFASVRTLAERKDVQGLIRAMGNRDPAVQYEAVEALGNLRDPAATRALVDALTGDQYSGIRWKAAEALGKIGAPAVPSLVRALENPDEDIRWKAAVTLGEIGDPRSVGPLVRLLSDRDRFVRSRAAYALGLIGPPAVAELAGALQTGGTDVRRGAAAALGAIASPDAVAALIRDLDDPSDEVRQDVIAALSRGGEGSLAPLGEALRDPVRRRAEGAALALAGSGSPGAARALESALGDADPGVRPLLQSALNDLLARLARQASGREPPDAPGGAV